MYSITLDLRERSFDECYAALATTGQKVEMDKKRKFFTVENVENVVRVGVGDWLFKRSICSLVCTSSARSPR